MLKKKKLTIFMCKNFRNDQIKVSWDFFFFVFFFSNHMFFSYKGRKSVYNHVFIYRERPRVFSFSSLIV